ncbi:MAG: FkbM family methyltransferase [Ornithinibacter sp.]
MNLLRRTASLPGVRAVLLSPRVRRVLASVLALRFLTAAWATTRPFAVLSGELLARGQIRTYRIRATGVPVALQHGRDLEALFELFSRGEYDPPDPLRDRLGPDAVTTVLDVGANVGMFSAWARGRWPQARIVAVEPAPENVAVLVEQAGQDGRTEVVVAAVAPADGETGFVEGWGAGSHLPSDAEEATTVVRTVDWFPLFAAADLVKMDIEGGEWPVLTDPRLADLERLTLVMEYHRVGAPSLPASAAARGLLEAAGFEVGHETPNYWGHGTLWAWKG